MRSVPITLAALAVTCALAVPEAGAQCTHISGSPPPTDWMPIASKVVLRKAAGGLFGDGNDRFKVLKGHLPTVVAIDPTTTDSVHITLRHTDEAGPTMLAISLPPGAPWAGGPTFTYVDTTASLGVRKARLKWFGEGYVYKVIGRNASVLNTPILSGDTVHLMIEIENGGVGYCFGRTLFCNATGGGANCF